MKLKKIIAAVVATATLLASAAVNATLYDDAGWTMTDAYPTAEGINARTPSVSITVEPMAVTDAIETKVISAGRGTSIKTEDNTDCYKVTYSITGIGDLYYACLGDDTYSNYAFVRLYDARVIIPTFGLKQHGVLSSTNWNGKSFESGAVTAVSWNAGSVANEYPSGTPEEGIAVENATMEAVVIYALNEGATVDVEPTVAITYDVKTASGNPSLTVNGTASSHLIMAPAAVVTRTITFVDYDNTSTDVVVNDGDAITAPDAKGQTGYTFNGWSSVGHSGAVDFTSGTTTATADAIYYAVYTKNPVPVTKVTISGSANATVGDSVQLTADVEPDGADNPEVTWSKVSGDGDVSATGVVTANSAGAIVAKAQTANGTNDTFTVTFAAATVPATSIEIKNGAAKALVGTDVTFTAEVAPPTTTDSVVWSISLTDGSPTDGATVNDGAVSATKAGQYKVTATAGSVSDSKVIAFFDAPVAPVVNKTVNTATKAEESEQKIGDYYYSTSHATVDTPDFVNFDYNVWARDIGGDQAIVGTVKAGDVEGSGTYNFILMIKSKNHKVVASWIAPALK